MKVSTLAACMVSAAALTFGASASNAAVTFGIKASTLTDGSTQSFAPETVFGTNFSVATSGGFSVITPPPGSEGGQFKSPWFGGPDATYQNQTSATYFSVGGTNQPSPQTVNFLAPITGLTILLGSIDSYNEFLFNGVDLITGNDIAAALGLSGQTNYEQSAVIRFQGAISSLTVRSGQAAAEFAVAAVPLPAAGLLMLAGLGGLVASRKLRRRADA